MLALIFYPRFKSIWLVTAFLGCEMLLLFYITFTNKSKQDVDACPVPMLLKLTIYNFKVVFKILFKPQQHFRNLTWTLCQESECDSINIQLLLKPWKYFLIWWHNKKTSFWLSLY